MSSTVSQGCSPNVSQSGKRSSKKVAGPRFDRTKQYVARHRREDFDSHEAAAELFFAVTAN